MAKLVVGPLTKGLQNDVTPFNIDNESFPVLINAYEWRSRVKRKRGTAFLGRLTRNVYTQSLGMTDGSGNFSGNVISILSLGSTAQIKSSTITVTVGAATLTDDGAGVLSGGGATGTINYASGALTIASAPINTAVTITLAYYPGLPVLGLEPFVVDTSDVPGEVGFDTTYAYDISLNSPFAIHSVSFYNNPSASANYPGYTPKSTWTPLKWNLQDYQQVWTTNYQGSMWAVPGIEEPFNGGQHIGMQFKPITGFTITAAGPPATATLTITNHGLSIGDFLFLNEIGGITGANFQTCYVVAPAIDANNVNVEFPLATLGGAYTANGIAQYLTNTSDATKDCIRWYNGDPVNSVSAGTFLNDKGWVNFCPPLTSGSVGTFSIADLPPAQYYLVGARMVVPFKDRLLFFGVVVQSSTTGPFYLQDTIVYSQNGSPYYTASIAYSTVNPTIPVLVAATYRPMILPTNQTATVTSWWENATGFGGFISAGYARPITSVSPNEDALIIGFADRQARLLYSGNDIVPFNFYIINSELGSESTFSTVTLDRGVLSVGGRGIILTSQISSQRVDLEIPDEVFRMKQVDQGARRICAQRDFINEWIYFTYPSNTWSSKFPTRSLQYNYRDGTWGLFNESYTTYGLFRQRTGYTWGTIGNRFPTWGSWNETWSAGSSTLLQPQVIAGNQQGFIVFRDDGTNESRSLFISGITGSTITSPNHALNDGDYIVISNALGTIGSQINGKIFSVSNPTTNTFVLNPTIGSGTYLGEGTITRMYVPFIQTKQFPLAWDNAKKTRLGAQKYLLTRTPNGSCTLYIYLSQDAATPYNFGAIIPDDLSVNNSLIYSTILYTCPESTNLGLTPTNINLQMLTGSNQSQIWHRINTSLIGDTVQMAITFNDEQMRDTDFKQQFNELELHSIVLDVYPSQELA